MAQSGSSTEGRQLPLTTGDQQPDAGTLCGSCGLCCNGVLYSNAKAQPEEVPRMEASGLTVDRVGDRLQFRQPCPHSREGRCAIYGERFTKCRTFRCALLKRLDVGEVELPEALNAVSQAKAMVARVAALEPGSALMARRVARRREGPPRRDSGDPAAARLWVESMALEIYLDRIFRNKPAVETD